MPYIKFLNSMKKIQGGIIVPLDDHTIEVRGANKNTSGLDLYLDNGLLVGDYEAYIYPYQDIATKIYQYTDDGHTL